MAVVTLPRDFEAWAEAEVRAGAAESVEALALRVLERERRLAEFRATSDAAEANEEGRRPAAEVFAEVRARLRAEY